MTIPVAAMELGGTCLELICYGVYLVIFPQCLLTLRRKNASRHVSSGLMTYLFGTMLIAFVFITVHLCVDLVRVFTAFTSHMDVPDAPVAFYANVGSHLNITKNATYVSATLVADALLVYRTFVIWGRRYMILTLPVILYCFVFATSVWFTWSLNLAVPGNSVLVSVAFVRCKYFYAATFSLNIFCTVLIAVKIWTIQKSVSGYSTGTHHAGRALSIILESAAIYSAALMCLIGTAIAGESAMFFVLNPMPALIGSVFSYVVLRSSARSQQSQTTASTGTWSSPEFSLRHNTGHSHTTDKELGSTLGGVHVQLEQMVRHDSVCDYSGARSVKDNRQSFVPAR